MAKKREVEQEEELREAETPEEIAARLTEPVKARKPSKKNPPSKKAKDDASLAIMCDMAFMGAFQMAALATGHEHWRKTQEEVKVATEPLTAMIEELPAKTQKAISNSFKPVWFLIGMGMLIVPDVTYEIRIRRATREAARQPRQTPQPQVGGGGIHPKPPSPSYDETFGSNGGGHAEQPDRAVVSADPELRGLDQ